MCVAVVREISFLFRLLEAGFMGNLCLMTSCNLRNFKSFSGCKQIYMNIMNILQHKWDLKFYSWKCKRCSLIGRIQMSITWYKWALWWEMTGEHDIDETIVNIHWLFIQVCSSLSWLLSSQGHCAAVGICSTRDTCLSSGMPEVFAAQIIQGPMLSPTSLVTLWKEQLAWSEFFSLLACDCSEHLRNLVNYTERTSNTARNQMSQLCMSSG